MNYKKLIAVVLITLLMLILTACSQSDDDFNNASRQDEYDVSVAMYQITNDDPYAFIGVYFPSGRYGYSLGARNNNYHPMWPFLFLDNQQDGLVIEFANYKGSDAEFVLKILLDFQEADFRILSYENPVYISSYTFFLGDRQHISFPIALSERHLSNLDEYAHMIVMCIAQPNIHQKDREFFYNKRYGMAVPHYVFFNVEPEKKEAVTAVISGDFDLHRINWVSPMADRAFQSPAYTLPTPFYGFNVSANLTHNIAEYVQLFPPAYVIAQAGDEIKFHYVIGDITGGFTNRFVLIGLLDWQQVNLNGMSFLPVALNTNAETGGVVASYDSFVITAPTEPGMYEFLVYAIGVSNEVDWMTNIENSFRITIVVE